MIKHIVMFRLSGNTAQLKKDNILKLKELLDSLNDKIRVIRHLETGLNISTRPAAFDLVLISEFNSREDQQAYSDHPDHQKVVHFLNEAGVTIAVVDFES